MDSLTIEFSYSPKKLKDLEIAKKYIQNGLKYYAPGEYKMGYGTWQEYLPLVNFITLSVDDGYGQYRGCAHRHIHTQQHIISTCFASPGFVKGRIDKGTWRLMINVHAVVTDICDYYLKVIGSARNELVSM